MKIKKIKKVIFMCVVAVLSISIALQVLTHYSDAVNIGNYVILQ